MGGVPHSDDTTTLDSLVKSGSIVRDPAIAPNVKPIRYTFVLSLADGRVWVRNSICC